MDNQPAVPKASLIARNAHEEGGPNTSARPRPVRRPKNNSPKVRFATEGIFFRSNIQRRVIDTRRANCCLAQLMDQTARFCLNQICCDYSRFEDGVEISRVSANYRTSKDVRPHRKPTSKSRSKPLSILNRAKKCFDHLSADIVPVELVQLRQPEVIASVVKR
jgi:hypothetical protein